MKRLFGNFSTTYGTGLIIKAKLSPNEFLSRLLRDQTQSTFLKLFLLNFLRKKRGSNKSFLHSSICLLESLHLELCLEKTQIKNWSKHQTPPLLEKGLIVHDENLFKSKVLIQTEGQISTVLLGGKEEQILQSCLQQDLNNETVGKTSLAKESSINIRKVLIFKEQSMK